jgi:hypothetical protein
VASETNNSQQDTLMLPTSVLTRADVGQLVSELEDVEDSLLQLKARKTSDHHDHTTAPPIGKRLHNVAELNKLDLQKPGDRQEMKARLKHAREKAPLMYISFSNEPSLAFLEKLIVWLRREINPNLLISIGLQPAIGAGCIVRTTNKFFDLSLRQTFIKQRQLLLEQIVPDVNEAKST